MMVASFPLVMIIVIIVLGLTADMGRGQGCSFVSADRLQFIFRGSIYPNDTGYILLSEIGTVNLLFCTTTRTGCCTGDNAVGEFHFPNENLVPTRDVVRDNRMFRERGDQQIQLGQVTEQEARASPAFDSRGILSNIFGLYWCDIPDSSGNSQRIYINIVQTLPPGYTPPTRVVIISDPITSSGINTAGHQFNLTCTATVEGFYTSTIAWLDGNNMTVPSGGGDTRMVSTVMSNSSTHISILQFDPLQSLHAGMYTCQVSVLTGTVTEMRSINVTIVNLVSIFSAPFTVGNSTSATCISHNPANKIEWLDSQGRVVASVTSMNQLDLTFNPVNDSIHNSNYTCRVTRQDGSTDIYITTIRVNVPTNSLTSTITTSGSAVAGGMYSLQCDISTTIPGLANTPTATWIGPDGSPVTSGDNITITSNTVATSILTFNSLTTSQAGNYTCEGSIESPALESPQTIREIEEVNRQIPPPTVMVAVPSGTLYAGTNTTLTCTITVDDVVNTDVEVDITWTPSSDRLNIQTTTGSRPSFTSTVTVSPLSSADTGFTCSAVVRPPSGNSFVTASSPGMDTGDVTVQVSLSPTVDISTVSLSILGDPFSLTCTVTVVENLIQPPTVMWTGPGVDQTDAEITGPIVSGPVTTLTLSFSPLHTSHEGQYTCRAVLDIPTASFPAPLTGMDSQDVTVLDPFFQLRLTGISDCLAWVTDRATAKSADITAAVMANIARRCQCNFTIGAGGFQCIQDSVVYRAEVQRTGNAQTTASNVIVHIEDWVTSGTGIVVQSLFINIDSSCGVIVRDLNDKCPPRLDTELTSNVPTVPTAMTESVTDSSQTMKPAADNSAVITGGAVAVVALLVFALTAIVIAALVVWSRRSVAIRNNVRRKQDPLPAVVLSDISQIGDYDMGHEYYEELDKFNEDYAKVKPPETQQATGDYKLTQCPAYERPCTQDKTTPATASGGQSSSDQEKEDEECQGNGE